MTQPSEMEIAKAREIRLKIEGSARGGILVQSTVEEIIARAMHDAAKVKAGCVRTEDGVEHRVLGELAFTADGCLSGVWDGEIWTPHRVHIHVRGVLFGISLEAKKVHQSLSRFTQPQPLKLDGCGWAGWRSHIQSLVSIGTR